MTLYDQPLGHVSKKEKSPFKRKKSQAEPGSRRVSYSRGDEEKEKTEERQDKLQKKPKFNSY